MTWLARKKLGFIPVHRLNAQPPDAAVPADWPGSIMARLFYDPDPATKFDLSLRAFIHAASLRRKSAG